MSRKAKSQTEVTTVTAGEAARELARELRILWDTEPAAYHVDGASVAVSPEGQFALVLCAVSPEPPTKLADGRVEGKARIVSSVRMAPQTFLALTRTMVNVWNSYAEGVASRAPGKEAAEKSRKKNGRA
jgi:hypothetical protein